jgi:hypothetical protein
MVDGGSNVCVTGDISALLDPVDIDQVTISVALDGTSTAHEDCITKRGLLPLALPNGTTYYQPCYYCENLVETIISPAAILASSNTFTKWAQVGHKDPSIPGSLCFYGSDATPAMEFRLHCRDGLYYISSAAYTTGPNPVRVICHRASTTLHSDDTSHHIPPTPSRAKLTPTTGARQVESEVWSLRLGCPGEQQLKQLLSHVVGTPQSFKFHPFHYIHFKEQAYIRKQPAGRTAVCLPNRGMEFFMDFGFMRASAKDYKRPNKKRTASSDHTMGTAPTYLSSIAQLGASGRSSLQRKNLRFPSSTHL